MANLTIRNVPEGFLTELCGKLAGEWDDSRSAEEIIRDILARRTLGRRIEGLHLVNWLE